MSWVASAILGSGVVSAAGSAYAASQQSTAAQAGSAAQLQAATRAQDMSMNMYNTTRGDLASFRNLGAGAASTLGGDLSSLTAPITPPTLPTLPNAPGPMDQATLEATPGYQFNLTQGEKAVSNAAAARGLGVSGAALKGATTFATGLADSTYQNQFANAQTIFGNKLNLAQTQYGNQQQQFQNQVTNQSNAYNRLMGVITTGENAAAQTGVTGAALNNTAANASIAGGNAIQAGLVNSANAQAAGINSGLGSLTSGVTGYAAYNNGYGSSGLYGNGLLTNADQPGINNALNLAAA